jgi:hypothetical protein
MSRSIGHAILSVKSDFTEKNRDSHDRTKALRVRDAAEAKFRSRRFDASGNRFDRSRLFEEQASADRGGETGGRSDLLETGEEKGVFPSHGL